MTLVAVRDEAGALICFEFDEEKHPKGEGGRFIETGDKPEGGGLRPLVEPLTLFGGKYEGAGKTVFAVERNDGTQMRCFLNSDLTKGQTPSKDEVQQALSHAADLADKYGLANVSLEVVSPNGMASGAQVGTIAYTQPGQSNTISLVGREAFKDTQKNTRDMMPSAKTGDYTRSVMSHEIGHLQQSDSRTGGGGMYLKIKDEPGNLGMSRYGMTDHYEAYAEAFSEFHTTDGLTDNVAAQAYASEYGWKP